MNAQPIENYQMVGESNGSNAGNIANAEIAKARRETPEELRSQFRSYIKWNGKGYTYGWIIK